MLLVKKAVEFALLRVLSKEIRWGNTVSKEQKKQLQMKKYKYEFQPVPIPGSNNDFLVWSNYEDADLRLYIQEYQHPVLVEDGK